MNTVEIIDIQSTVISMQSRVINELFILLSNYLTAEELDNISVVKTINEVANIYNSINYNI
jgi:hypothetical protein